MPAINLFKLPDAITDDVAAFFDPFGNAAHTALVLRHGGRRRADHRRRPDRHHGRGHRRHVGARHVVITDVNDYRLDLARKMGATRAVNVNARSLIRR
jgi:threonine 3-dehydrogenase